VLIQDIKKLLSRNNIFLCHILRDGNQWVDVFAKFEASSNGDLSIHTSPSKDILDLLRSDAVKTYFLKNVFFFVFVFFLIST
jgi:hypothetical protein